MLVFVSIFVAVDFPLILVLDVAAPAVLGYWIVQKNKKSNLPKSEAFVKRDGLLYHIALGYSIENEDGIKAVYVLLGGPQSAPGKARC